MSDLVSVVIPTFDRARYVTQAIDTVLAQDYENLEVIVVDDGSTDSTQEALLPYEGRIRVLKQENRGASAARNNGILAATGEWVAFLDSDDEWLPGKISLQMKEAREAGVFLHTSGATLVEGGQTRDLFEVTGFANETTTETVIERPLAWQIHYGLARLQCMLVRRSALFEAGLFEKKRRIEPYEDQDLACRLALLGPWRFTRTPLARICRRQETVVNLSETSRRAPLRAFGSLAIVYESLLSSPKLTSSERTLVKKVLCSYEGMLGMELIREGRQQQARELLWKSVQSNPGIRAGILWLLAMLPAPLGSAAARQWASTRG